MGGRWNDRDDTGADGADEYGSWPAEENSAVPDMDGRSGDGSGPKRDGRCGDGRGEDDTPMMGVNEEAADSDRGRGSTALSGEVAGDWPSFDAVSSFDSLSGIVAVSMRDVKRRDGCGVTNTESLLPPATVADMAEGAASADYRSIVTFTSARLVAAVWWWNARKSPTKDDCTEVVGRRWP